MTKTEARGRGRRGISKTRNVRTKALTADRRSRGAQRSVKQGRYNWLYIHLISSFLWSCILWFSLQLFKGTPVSSSNSDTTRVDVQYIKVVITKSELNPKNSWCLKLGPGLPPSCKTFLKDFSLFRTTVLCTKMQISMFLISFPIQVSEQIILYYLPWVLLNLYKFSNSAPVKTAALKGCIWGDFFFVLFAFL